MTGYGMTKSEKAVHELLGGIKTCDLKAAVEALARLAIEQREEILYLRDAINRGPIMNTGPQAANAIKATIPPSTEERITALAEAMEMVFEIAEELHIDANPLARMETRKRFEGLMKATSRKRANHDE